MINNIRQLKEKIRFWLLKKLLTSGEKSIILQVINQKIATFDDDDIIDLKDNYKYWHDYIICYELQELCFDETAQASSLKKFMKKYFFRYFIVLPLIIAFVFILWVYPLFF